MYFNHTIVSLDNGADMFILTDETGDVGLETMVFPEHMRGKARTHEPDYSRPLAEHTRRYATLGDAEKGHVETVEALTPKN